MIITFVTVKRTILNHLVQNTETIGADQEAKSSFWELIVELLQQDQTTASDSDSVYQPLANATDLESTE
jgi:hypothetical protein